MRDIEILKEQLEIVEHQYWCYDKDCPVCEGINHHLIELYGEYKEVHHTLADIENSKKKMVKVGEIYSVDVDSPLPILVLITEVKKWYCRGVRVTLFPQFKSQDDIVFKEWLIQPWNSFPVLKCRLSNKITEVDKSTLQAVKDFKQQEINEDLILMHYKSVELKYQNELFLDEDEELIMEYIESKGSLLEKIKKYISETGEKIVEDVAPGFLPTFADNNVSVDYGFDTAKKLIEFNDFYVYYTLILINETTYVKIFIYQYTGEDVEKITVVKDNKKYDFDCLINKNEEVVIQFEKSSGEYLVNLEILDDEITIPIKIG